MTHAARLPGSRDEMVVALMRAYWKNPRLEVIPGDAGAWNHAAELVSAWVQYERDLTRYAIDSKLKAERERAIEEAKQRCYVLAEKSRPFSEAEEMARWCASSIDALKVVP